MSAITIGDRSANTGGGVALTCHVRPLGSHGRDIVRSAVRGAPDGTAASNIVPGDALDLAGLQHYPAYTPESHVAVAKVVGLSVSKVPISGVVGIVWCPAAAAHREAMNTGSVRPPPSRRHPVRVVLIDASRTVRDAVADLLEIDPAVSVVGQAGTLDRALPLLAGLEPDVAIIDPRLPDGDGLELCRHLRATGAATRCLILTSDTEPDAMLAAVDAGAAGYIIEDLTDLALGDAVKSLAVGRSHLGPHSPAVRHEACRQRGDHLPALTTMETAIMLLVADGLTDQQIADRLFFTEATIDRYIAQVQHKLGLDTRAQVGAHADRHPV
ncbi:response regulator transcription factor [Nocardia sp. NPDC051981]|uniref:response regulator transcription factor n=1 Tax=Nocardia sp. NPDC051981 TaxID=3155417 RepID=UPI0034479F19